MIELVLPSAHRVHNLNGKSTDSAISVQLMAESPHTLQWATLSPKIAPSDGGSGPHLIHDSLRRAENPNGITIGSAVIAQVTADCPYTLQWAPLSPKIAPSYGGS